MAPTAPNPPQAAPQQQYGLQLPSAVFAKVAPYSHLAAHLFPTAPSPQTVSKKPERPPRRSLRPSGRTPSQFRKPTCVPNTLAHCNGSAVVRLEHGTSVVCGIQAEVLTLPPSLDGSNDGTERRSDHDRHEEDRRRLASLNLLVPNVDLATGADPEHLPTQSSGTAPSSEAQVLSSRILSLLLRSDVIALKDLQICGDASTKKRRRRASTDDSMDVDEDSDTSSSDSSSSSSSLSSNHSTTFRTTNEPEAYWVLHISLLALSISGHLTLFDALWASLIAALRTTRLPRAYWDADADAVLCDPDLARYRTLDVRGCPIAVGWGLFVAPRGRVGTLESAGIAGDAMDESRAGDGAENSIDARINADKTMHDSDDDKNALSHTKDQNWHKPQILPDGSHAVILADPEAGEDELCRETVTIVVDCSSSSSDKSEGGYDPNSREAQSTPTTEILALEKKGGHLLSWRSIPHLMPAAEQRWREWRAVIP